MFLLQLQYFTHIQFIICVLYMYNIELLVKQFSREILPPSSRNNYTNTYISFVEKNLYLAANINEIKSKSIIYLKKHIVVLFHCQKSLCQNSNLYQHFAISLLMTPRAIPSLAFIHNYPTTYVIYEFLLMTKGCFSIQRSTCTSVFNF